MRLHPPIVLGLLVFAAACGGSTPAPEPAPAPSVPSNPPPSGPTRSDFRAIAAQLSSRCVGGGWIQHWRSEHPDPYVTKPKLAFDTLVDETDEGLDADYLGSMLEARMRRSSVYEMVADPGEADFLAKARIARMAERSGGTRIPVYVTTLQIVDAVTGKTVRRCESVSEGEF